MGRREGHDVEDRLIEFRDFATSGSFDLLSHFPPAFSLAFPLDERACGSSYSRTVGGWRISLGAGGSRFLWISSYFVCCLLSF